MTVSRSQQQGPEDQQETYPLSECMTCGCCMEVCPQYSKIELDRYPGESDEAFAAREAAEHDKAFVGPAVISQAVLFNNHPTGKLNKAERGEYERLLYVAMTRARDMAT